jgi:predicted pyridoxine 5'-phosphate oxidase superfamily flavin-nucleotide-binding protein
MPYRFAEIAFTPTVRKVQDSQGSREAYARMEAQPDERNRQLGAAEVDFIAARDSFYMATVGETGWPYVQHRGGPAGFLRVLDETTIGFADFRGNRQYVTVGNLETDNRVSLFLMDYRHRRRLKIFGRATIIGPDDRAMLARLEIPDYRARVERGALVSVEAFDWNCPQHITERFTGDEVVALTEPLRARIAELEAELARRPLPGPQV